jgi:hypothetical protein
MAKKKEGKTFSPTQARSKPKKKKDLPRSISGALLEGKK